MSNVNIAYGPTGLFVITLTGLPTNSIGSVLTGQTSVAISNSGVGTLYLDYLVGGKVTAGTTPTTARQIEIHAYGAIDDTPTYPDTILGTDANKVITSDGIKSTILKPLSIISTDDTSSREYWFGPVSVASAFGGILPKNWGIFVAHNTAVNLNITGTNHSISYTPVYLTNA